MKIPVFVSRPTPYITSQIHFINRINQILSDDGFEPLTVGAKDCYTNENALPEIRNHMTKSNGIICVAFRRSLIEKGLEKPLTSKQSEIKGQWITSPFCHIETAMAYMINLPTLILKENGVLEEGVLEQRVTGIYSPDFEINDASSEDYLESDEWKSFYKEWRKRVILYENNDSLNKYRTLLSGHILPGR